MIEAIVQPGVVAAEVIGDAVDLTIFPEEEEALGPVGERRRHDFAGGRSCAHRAMAMLGVSPTPILPTPSRAPSWPQGLVGSITHCPGYCAAAVGFERQFRSLGIDAEIHAPLPVGVLDMIAVENEYRWIAEIAENGICWDRLLFSAKESIYKAWFPIVGRWLGFKDVAVEVEPENNTFRAHVLLPSSAQSISSFDGVYLTTNDYVLTFVAVTRFGGSGELSP
jgi:4'-phosphopantetheinyl transferase EntD